MNVLVLSFNLSFQPPVRGSTSRWRYFPSSPYLRNNGNPWNCYRYFLPISIQSPFRSYNQSVFSLRPPLFTSSLLFFFFFSIAAFIHDDSFHLEHPKQSTDTWIRLVVDDLSHQCQHPLPADVVYIESDTDFNDTLTPFKCNPS